MDNPKFVVFRLNPLPMLANQIHKPFHGFGFGDVEFHRTNQAFAFDLGLSEISTREM